MTERGFGSRAQAVFEEFLSFREQETPRYIEKARLAHEAHEHGYWSHVVRPGGASFLSEEEFLEECLNTANPRTALKYLALGKAIDGVPATLLASVETCLRALSFSKIVVLAPVLKLVQEPEDLRYDAEKQSPGYWLLRASEARVAQLQREVSVYLGAKPRGLPEEGKRQRNLLLAMSNELEWHDLVAEVLRVGALVMDDATPYSTTKAAFQEALVTWSPMAAHRTEAGVTA